MKYLIAFLLLGLTINLEAKQKPRAINLYIRYYKEVFADKYISRVLKDEIPMGEGILGSKWSFLKSRFL